MSLLSISNSDIARDDARSRVRTRVDSALLAAIVLLVGGEMLCRCGVLRATGAQVGPAQGYYPAPHVFDAKCGYRYAPQYEGRFIRRDFEAKMTTNAWGFRDPHMSLAKSDGVFRVALLGDSMLAANEVPTDQIWSSRLKALLPTVDGQRVEFLNFGVDGYLLWNMAGLLESDVLAFKPDLVVVWATPRSLATTLPRYRAVTRHNEILESSDAEQLSATLKLENRRWESIQQWVADHSNLVGYLHARVGKVAKPNMRRIAARETAEVATDPVPLLVRMQRKCAAADVGFAILLREGHQASELPAGMQAMPIYSDAGVVDDFDALRWEHDAHFNIEGHRRYADAILPVMRSIIHARLTAHP